MTERPWKIRYVALAASAMIGLWAGLAHAEERRLPYEARTQRSCHHMQSSRHEWVREKEGGLSQSDCSLPVMPATAIDPT